MALIPVKKSFYKWCFVPLCTNTTVSSPEKIFFNVPREKSKRHKWLKAAKRNIDDITTKSVHYCCQDHFTIKTDTVNWMRVQLMPDTWLKLKPDVVPHIFNCQLTRKTAHANASRSAFMKRQSISLVNEAIEQSTQQHNEESLNVMTSNIHDDFDEDGHVDNEANEKETVHPERRFADKGTQCRTSYRSRSTNTNPLHFPRTSTIIACSPIKFSSADAQTSPIKRKKVFNVDLSQGRESEIGIDDCETSAYSSEESSADISDSQSEVDSEEVADEEINRHRVISTMLLVERTSRVYLGIPDDCNILIQMLTNKLQCRNAKRDVLLTLRKIRLNESFRILGLEFGMSFSNATRIFQQTLIILAKVLRDFIIWPEARVIKNNLPIPFRCRYNKVQSIIDCLEIEIEKPSDPVKQSLTWSEYKKANTLKYLVSSTPDGVINFVSTGYGGRISDALLVEKCGYLDKLSTGMHVMADRGFKQLERALVDRGCVLVRPPSVSSSEASSKSDVMQTKVIASLRIHIERVVRRIREFAFLKPHSCIDIHSIHLTDDAITVAAAISNCQGPLIK